MWRSVSKCLGRGFACFISKAHAGRVNWHKRLVDRPPTAPGFATFLFLEWTGYSLLNRARWEHVRIYTTNALQIFKWKQSTINFNENVAQRQLFSPRHFLQKHSSYSRNSPFFFSLRENKCGASFPHFSFPVTNMKAAVLVMPIQR